MGSQLSEPKKREREKSNKTFKFSFVDLYEKLVKTTKYAFKACQRYIT